MAVTKVVMPKVSEAIKTGEIIRWFKNEGDRVENGDILAEVETDKADVEIVAFGAGVLRKILVRAGESAPVGALIAVIAKTDDGITGVLSAALVDRVFYPQGFLDRVFHGLVITALVGFLGMVAVVIVHATIVELPKEFYFAASVLLAGSFSLMLVLCGLAWVARWFASRVQKGYVDGLLWPFFKALAIFAGVLLVGLSLGEEYRLLRVDPVLYKWIVGLLIGSLVTLFVLFMAHEA
jgi:hypothetical protein